MSRDGATVRIYGYPGEKDKVGDPCEMSGKASFYPLPTKRRMLSYTIQTTEGQSGAPILLATPSSENQSIQWAIVGVHIGSIPQGPKKYFNLGTSISEDDIRWIETVY